MFCAAYCGALGSGPTCRNPRSLNWKVSRPISSSLRGCRLMEKSYAGSQTLCKRSFLDKQTHNQISFRGKIIERPGERRRPVPRARSAQDPHRNASRALTATAYQPPSSSTRLEKRFARLLRYHLRLLRTSPACAMKIRLRDDAGRQRLLRRAREGSSWAQRGHRPEESCSRQRLDKCAAKQQVRPHACPRRSPRPLTISDSPSAHPTAT